MGRAYEVRKASIQKTGAAKAKLYSMYAREIYQAAKNGGVELESNPMLKRLVERAKKEQVPSDIINRAIDTVNSGVDESYQSVRYELFGPGGSTVLVDCLTDNVNRSVSNIRAVLNKTNSKMGVSGSVAFNYDNICIVSFAGLTTEQVMDSLIEKNIDVIDIIEDDLITVYGNPQDLFQIKEAILSINPKIEFETDEITMVPKDTITLTGEDKENFDKLTTMLEEIDDVKNIYHNVEV